MTRLIKIIGLLMVASILAASCNKPNDPNDGDGNVNVIDGHAYVDLGLPSSIMWATCNIGADTPEGYGDYFAWGETAPKMLYDWKSYRYGNFRHDRYELSKYCTDTSYGLDGFVDGKAVMELADDAVKANWGADWRMPTIEEWKELFLNTTGVWTTLNGVKGWRITASNGNSLFLPAAGYYWDGELNAADLGVYWSVSLNVEYPYRAWGFHFNSFQCHLCGSSDRNRGQTVRAVCSAK